MNFLDWFTGGNSFPYALRKASLAPFLSSFKSFNESKEFLGTGGYCCSSETYNLAAHLPLFCASISASATLAYWLSSCNAFLSDVFLLGILFDYFLFLGGGGG